MNITPPAHSFSKIKDIYLQTANCDFYHGHHHDKKTPFFLGRHKAKERLKMLLLRSQSPSGAYLVTGFRGMGKTSLVHQALAELKEKHGDERPFEKITLSLSQDDVRDLDVLRLIARQLYSKWKELFVQKSFWRRVKPVVLLLTAVTSFCIFLLENMILPHLQELSVGGLAKLAHGHLTWIPKWLFFLLFMGALIIFNYR